MFEIRFTFALFLVLPVFYNTSYAGNARAEVIFYHTDHLGSTRVATNREGGIEKSIKFYPYGKIIHNSKVKSQGASVNYLYTGQEWEEETALYYYIARYYDAGIGRFISPDPFDEGEVLSAGGDLRIPQSLNRYSYVLDNPLRYFDSNGKEEEEYSMKHSRHTSLYCFLHCSGYKRIHIIVGENTMIILGHNPKTDELGLFIDVGPPIHVDKKDEPPPAKINSDLESRPDLSEVDRNAINFVKKMKMAKSDLVFAPKYGQEQGYKVEEILQTSIGPIVHVMGGGEDALLEYPNGKLENRDIRDVQFYGVTLQVFGPEGNIVEKVEIPVEEDIPIDKFLEHIFE